jgi:hypothetical protein
VSPALRVGTVLVEAKFPDTFDLGTAVDRAAAMGARYISNSWEGPELFDLGLVGLSGSGLLQPSGRGHRIQFR